jgi:hypothetical protein
MDIRCHCHDANFSKKAFSFLSQRIFRVNPNEASILSGAELGNLNRSGKYWLIHACTCLGLYAAQRKITVRIRHACCEAGNLHIVAVTDSYVFDDKAAVTRIVRSALYAQRLLRDGDQIKADSMEMLRTHRIFSAAFLDPKIKEFAADWLWKLAANLERYDRHTRWMRVVAIYAPMGGAGRLVLEFSTRTARTRLQIAAEIDKLNTEMEGNRLPGIEWREYLPNA